MSANKMSEPAFPVDNGYGHMVGGLTKREYALIHIAAGLASDINMTPEGAASDARRIADALGFKEKGGGE